MAENKQNISDNKAAKDEEEKVHIEPSESKTANIDDPGRTPGKAEGEDDESATK